MVKELYVVFQKNCLCNKLVQEQLVHLQFVIFSNTDTFRILAFNYFLQFFKFMKFKIHVEIRNFIVVIDKIFIIINN